MEVQYYMYTVMKTQDRGCYTDDPNNRTLKGQGWREQYDMTYEWCATNCTRLQYPYFGLEYGRELLWEFQQDIRLLGDFNHKYKHQHEYLIFHSNIYYYKSVSEQELFYQPNFYIFQLQINRHDSHDADNWVNTSELNRVRGGYVRSTFPTVELTIIYRTQSLSSAVYQFQYVNLCLGYKVRSQHAWDVPNLHHAPS